MQHGNEHGALDVEFKAAPRQMVLHHRGAARLFPQSPEQQRCADTRAGNRACFHGRQRDAALAVPGDRAQQPIKLAVRGEHILSTERLKNSLTHPSPLANAFDQVEIGVAAGLFLDDVHAMLCS